LSVIIIYNNSIRYINNNNWKIYVVTIYKYYKYYDILIVWGMEGGIQLNFSLSKVFKLKYAS